MFAQAQQSLRGNPNMSRGAHLEATGVNRWLLLGESESVRLELIDGRWHVSSSTVVAEYSMAALALAHAYQLACSPQA